MNSTRSTGNSPTIATHRKLGIAGLTALLLVIFAMHHSLHAEEAASSVDDGWRRTKDGWEHVSTWPLTATEALIDRPPSAAAQISPAAEHWLQLHPGLLAVGMCLAAGIVLRIPAS